jgi:hypothetical protein
MSGLLQKAVVAAALALSFGFGAAHCDAIAIDIAGGTSVNVGGWQVAPGLGITLNGVSFDGTTDTLTIQNNAAAFSSGTPFEITFTQTAASAAPSILFSTASIQNLTTSTWTGFNFTVSGAAIFDGVGNVFIPPLSSGVNYSSVNLSIDHTMLSYVGSQAPGSTSSWGGTTLTDELLIDALPASDAPFASFTVDEAPTGVSSAEAVAAPSSAWLSLVGLAVVAGIPRLRRATVRVR